LNKHQIKKNNQTYLIQFKKRKDEKQTGIWIDSTKAIIVTLQDGKKQLVKSNLILK
jgi:hypothetical protein